MSEPAGNILLRYQQRWVADGASVKVWEKSRRIGATWCEAADAALDAARQNGTDWWYLGYNKEMAQEFIEEAAGWARRVAIAAAAIEEIAIENADRAVLAFRIRFASGNKIVALSSRPANLRGKQGVAVIDEAAFHDDLGGLLKASLAFTMWGGRVHVISTHNGAGNAFNALVSDIRSGRRPYSLHRTTLDDALGDGLYRAICRSRTRRGSGVTAQKPDGPEYEDGWSPEAEQAWREQLFADYGEDAGEELLCIPNQSTAVFIPSVLIEARMNPAIPVVRFGMEAGALARGDEALRKDADDFCETELEPILQRLDPRLMSCFGMDFGRSGDLSVIWPMQIGAARERADGRVDSWRSTAANGYGSGSAGLLRHTPFVVELRNVPFKQQEQILFHIVDRLPRFIGGAMDARGNGQYLAETAQLRYGAQIEGVMLSLDWYRDNMPRYKAAFEDASVELPADPEILADHRMLRMENGVAKLPERRIRGEGGRIRHGDSAIAGALAWYASRRDGREYSYTKAVMPIAPKRDDAAADEDEVARSGRSGLFTQRLRFNRGAW